MIVVLRRNWSSRGKAFARASGLVVSIPKSGRTWLRVFFNYYVTSLYGVPFTLSSKELQSAGLPNLEFTHDLWQHRTGLRFKERLRGRSLVPRHMTREKTILLLARDPRDVIVSNFFQLTRRKRKRKQKIPPLSLSEMLRHRVYGVRHMVQVMNTWMESWSGQDNFKLVRYEDCRLHPETFEEILSFLELEIREDLLFRSLEFSRFENMKSMEREERFGKILQPADPTDLESFKVRRGVVGGYKEYLSAEDIADMNEALMELDSRFGYTADTDTG